MNLNNLCVHCYTDLTLGVFLFQFSQLKEDTFKSNVLCVFVLWMFVAASLAVMIPS